MGCPFSPAPASSPISSIFISMAPIRILHAKIVVCAATYLRASLTFIAERGIGAPPYIDNIKITGYITGNIFRALIMVKAQRKAVNRFRKRLKRQGMARVEINVRKDDAACSFATSSGRFQARNSNRTARALLREHFGSRRTEGLKALLASAPLEGLDLSRERDFGRNVDLRTI